MVLSVFNIVEEWGEKLMDAVDARSQNREHIKNLHFKEAYTKT
jgi:hypothetical protein